MVLRNIFRDAVENAGPRQDTKHGDHLAEVTACPHLPGQTTPPASFTTSNPAPIFTSVLAAVHKDALASDISGEVVE